MTNFNPFSLSGKIILVTGASSGIGKAIAITCSKMGASVIITGRNDERLQSVFLELEGENNLCINADLTDKIAIANLVDKLPKLDGIVQCAGVGHRQLAKHVTASDIEEVFNVNFSSAVLLQTAILSGKKINKSASVVFIASVAANFPSIGNGIYSASKGAIISYARCLALELAPRQIRVNCICPAMIWTDLIYKGGLTKDFFEDAQLEYPLKRYGQPEDVANLAVFLLSDASSWMTGSCVDLTGGTNKL